MTDAADTISGLLVLPHLRVQNANAISSPLTWGFPSMTAFLGLMHALQRRLASRLLLPLQGVGVICHHFDAQVSRNGYVQAFHLTRNPVDNNGDTAAIVEEGRIHLDLTLVLGLGGLDGNAVAVATPKRRAEVASLVGDVLAGMRIAGGSVMPPLPRHRRRTTPYVVPLPAGDVGDAAFRQLRRQWLPGFALVSRDDLLDERLAQLREQWPEATRLDAWLDVSRLTYRCTSAAPTEAAASANAMDEPPSPPAAKTAPTAEAPARAEWVAERPPGWIVPIPVGYGALSELHPAGSVAGARDRRVPFRFVESLYSLGQWVSPHRLGDAQDLLWFNQTDPDRGLYRCTNDYRGGASLAALFNDD